MRVTCSILFFIASAIALTSCKNNDNVFTPVVITGLTVVNASSDTINYYLNGTRQNNNSYIFPRGADINRTVVAGLQNYQFKKLGVSTALFSLPLTLTDSTYNSLYVVGETAALAFHTVDSLPVVSNSLTSDTAYVRFVNAAPDAGALNVFVGSNVTFNGKIFKSSSSFVPLISGQNEVKIYLAGSSTPKVDTTISFIANSTYTLFAKGLVAGKGNAAFNVGILINP